MWLKWDVEGSKVSTLSDFQASEDKGIPKGIKTAAGLFEGGLSEKKRRKGIKTAVNTHTHRLQPLNPSTVKIIVGVTHFLLKDLEIHFQKYSLNEEK